MYVYTPSASVRQRKIERGMECMLACVHCTPRPPRNEALSPKQRGKARARSSTDHPQHREQGQGHVVDELEKQEA